MNNTFDLPEPPDHWRDIERHKREHRMVCWNDTCVSCGCVAEVPCRYHRTPMVRLGLRIVEALEKLVENG